MKMSGDERAVLKGTNKYLKKIAELAGIPNPT